MEKAKLLIFVVIITLSLALMNVISTFYLSRRLDSLSDKILKELKFQSSSKHDIRTELPSRIQASVGNAPVKGAKNAPVAIIEFSDFQCPFSGRFFAQTFPQLEQKYITTGKIKFVYRNFPLPFHNYAQKVAQATECANEQGKFWEYHDKVFANQNALDTESLKRYAQELSLDKDKFNECLDSNRMMVKVEQDMEDGSSYGVRGTPTFFINGIMLVGAQPYSVFERIIEQELNPGDKVK